MMPPSCIIEEDDRESVPAAAWVMHHRDGHTNRFLVAGRFFVTGYEDGKNWAYSVWEFDTEDRARTFAVSEVAWYESSAWRVIGEPVHQLELVYRAWIEQQGSLNHKQSTVMDSVFETILRYGDTPS